MVITVSTFIGLLRNLNEHLKSALHIVGAIKC